MNQTEHTVQSIEPYPKASYRVVTITPEGGPKLLTVVTRRHSKRNGPIFQKHRESIEAQNRALYEIVELHGARSVTEANHALGLFDVLRHARSKYVMTLDDDDRFTQNDIIDMLHRVAERRGYPPWIMLRGNVGPFCYPRPWGPRWRPIFATIPSFSLVARRDIWKACCKGWRGGGGGDFRFSKAMWEAGHRPFWPADKRVHVATIRVSGGKPE